LLVDDEFMSDGEQPRPYGPRSGIGDDRVSPGAPHRLLYDICCAGAVTGKQQGKTP
jgi:hypothetical protein